MQSVLSATCAHLSLQKSACVHKTAEIANLLESAVSEEAFLT